METKSLCTIRSIVNLQEETTLKLCAFTIVQGQRVPGLIVIFFSSFSDKLKLQTLKKPLSFKPALHYTNTIPSCDSVLVHLQHYISSLVVTLLYTLCHSTLRWRTRAHYLAIGHKWHWRITVTVLCGVSESIHSFLYNSCFSRLSEQRWAIHSVCVR